MAQTLRPSLGRGRWGTGRGCFGLFARGGDGDAGELVFLVEGGVFELQDELVEALFQEAVEVVERLLEVLGSGGFFAAGAAGAA